MMGKDLAGRKVPGDDYTTPAWAVKALFMAQDVPGTVWDPACGSGVIVRVAHDMRHESRGTDIKGGCDLFEFTGRHPRITSEDWSIVTNPPYSIATQFVAHTLKLNPTMAAFLLRLSFLEGSTRRDLLFNTRFYRLWVFPSRITMYPDGQEKPKNSGTAAYGWFVWTRGQFQVCHPAQVCWLRTEKEVEKDFPNWQNLPRIY